MKESQVSFPLLADRLRSTGQVAYNDYMLRFRAEDCELNLFPDGRAIIKGVNDDPDVLDQAP